MIRLAILVAASIGCCSAHAEAQTWSFVTAVGGMSIQAPQHTDKGWVLPVSINVSGLERVTEQPTLLDSALVCERTQARIEGTNIFLTVHTGLIRKGAVVRCPPAALGPIAPGTYQVFYRGPGEKAVPLGDAHVAF